MECFTKKEYLERLSDLIPDCYQRNRLLITSETVRHATQMIEELSAALHEAFADIVENDLVVDVKNTARDLYALGRFLDISFETIIMDTT
ncbi:hypothetical protein LCGC14_0456940 [marine sediment metagenome]|uniref:Uncharacterized protein n=1 Tax=marine sediment metagenome TaxID=412755 RepID=A0A0F9SZ96_9ZZZZ|nr:hypothetical protein [Candidatus Aminicenantes bacterium]